MCLWWCWPWNKKTRSREGVSSLVEPLSSGIETLSAQAKAITLISSDNKSFIVDEQVASESLTIKNIIEDGCAEDGVPLPNVTGDTLEKVIEFCKKHVSHKSCNGKHEDLVKWDARFVSQCNEAALYDLVSAAHYLVIKDLYELMCQACADVLKLKSVAGILKTLSIGNDFKIDP